VSALTWFGAVLAGVGLLAGLAATARRQAVSTPFIVVEVAGIGLLGLSAYLSAGAARAERLLRLNAQAEADSTHHFLQNQLQIATRLITQKPLPQHATATVTIRVPGDTVVRVDTVLVGDTLRAHLDTNGVHVGAVVAVLPPATWRWTLRQDPLSYRVTFQGCVDRAAHIRVEGPPWQPVQLTDLAQDPNLCNPRPSSLFSLKPPSLVWAAALVLGTYLLAK